MSNLLIEEGRLGGSSRKARGSQLQSSGCRTRLGICSFTTTIVVLLLVIALQWALFTSVLLKLQHSNLSASQKDNVIKTATALITSLDEFLPTPEGGASSTTSMQQIQPEGVAATILFKAPKWFHLRYTAVLYNALNNIPDNWSLQVFINSRWIESDVYPWHPGLKRLLTQPHPRIIVTLIPVELTKGKPKQVYLSEWFWKSMASERLLLFSGNGALCANHNSDIWEMLSELDYCGTPSRSGQRGGDGSSHSYRNRSAMLKAIEYYQSKTQKDPSAWSSSEFTFFVRNLHEMNEEKNGSWSFRLASEEQSSRFGGVTGLASETQLEHLPLVVAGTQSSLTWTERDSLLKHCPEIKLIFPSLHEPSCFGAHPNGEACRATICALRDNLPSSGC